MEHCVFHPNRAAVEHCEVCKRALCGHCLWYTEDGHRLCEIHAQEREAGGETVLPPETYAEAINTQLVARQSDEKPRPRRSQDDKEEIPYKGNSQDLTALLAAVMSVTVLLSCMGGAYCLPIAAFLLGIVGFANAAKAVDPHCFLFYVLRLFYHRGEQRSVVGGSVSSLTRTPLVIGNWRAGST
jgi:hypothetical protein